MSRVGARRDAFAGLLVAAIGAVAILEGRTHTVGTLLRMGTGFFPIVLGAILVLLGAAIALAPALRPVESNGDVVQRPDWRGGGAILAGLALFIVLGAYAGLAPATFALVFVSALGDRQSSWFGAAVLASVLTATAWILFWYLLQVPFPIWRLWPLADG